MVTVPVTALVQQADQLATILAVLLDGVFVVDAAKCNGAAFKQ